MDLSPIRRTTVYPWARSELLKMPASRCILCRSSAVAAGEIWSRSTTIRGLWAAKLAWISSGKRLRYLDDSLQPPVAPILGWLYPRDPIASNQIPAEIMGGCTYVEG